LTDGLGNDSALALSTGAATITGTLNVSGTARISAATPTQEFFNTTNQDVWGSIFAQTSGTGSGASLVFSTKRDGLSATDKMTITQAGSVGIGVTPSAWAAGYKAIQGNFFTSYLFDQNVPANVITSNAYNDGTWKYGINAPAARLNVVGWTGVHTFDVAASGTAGNAITWLERARIDVDGLKFNGDTAAANALDDYEEGTFTPSTATTGYTISASSGAYTKIGRQVTIVCDFSFSAVNASSTSAVTIGGLPFTSGSFQSSGSVRESDVSGAIYGAASLTGTTNVFVNSMDGVVTGSQRPFATGDRYVMTLTYFV